MTPESRNTIAICDELVGSPSGHSKIKRAIYHAINKKGEGIFAFPNNAPKRVELELPIYEQPGLAIVHLFNYNAMSVAGISA